MSRRVTPTPLAGEHARTIERLIGAGAGTLLSVEHRQNTSGSRYVLKFSGPPLRFGGRWSNRLRIPARRIHGYQQRSPTALPRDVRARARQNKRRFWFWLLSQLPVSAPVIADSSYDDLAAIDEFRTAILILAHGGADEQSIERWLAGAA